MIEFETCKREERKTCKSEKEIQAFLSNKSFVLMYNKNNFVNEGYHEKTIKRELAYHDELLEPGKN